MPKKTERGDPLTFCRKISKKLKGDPLVNFLEKKVSQSRKYFKGIPFGPVEFPR